MLERFHCAGVCVAVLMLKRFVCVCLEGEITVYMHFRDAVCYRMYACTCMHMNERAYTVCVKEKVILCILGER